MSTTIRSLMAKIGIDLSQYTSAISDLKNKQTQIEASFRQVANSTDNWRQTTVGLAARISALNDKIAAQREILANIKAQHDAVAAAAGEDSEAADKLNRQYVAASKTLDSMNKELEDTKTALRKVETAEEQAGAEAKDMGNNIKGAETKTKSFKQSIKDFAQSSVGQFASIAGAVALLKQALDAVWNMVTEAAAFADELNTVSMQTGLATDQLQKFSYAARFIDTEVETFTKSLARLSKAMYEAERGGKNQKEAFEALGIEYKNADGSLRNNEKTMYDIIDALGNMADETRRDAIAMQLFGRSAQELNPLIKAGKAELDRYSKEAEEMGAVLDRGAIAKLGRLDDKLQRTSAIMEAQGRKMAAAFAPVVEAINDALVEIIKFGDQVKKEGDMLFFQLQGQTREQAEQSAKDAERLMEAWGVMGGSLDEFKEKAAELIQFYMSEGVPYTEAYNKALEDLANGYDLAGKKSEEAKTKLAEYDAVVQTATDDLIAKQEEYTKAVESRAATYMEQMGGLFDEFPKKTKVSGDKLLKNLESQVEGFKKWSINIETLAKRGVDKGLIEELRKMGPAAAPQVEALTKMTDEKLNEYVLAWKTKNELAKSEAVKALEPMRQDVEDKIKAVEKAVAEREAAWETLGKDLGEGVADGIKNSSGTIKQAALTAINNAMKTIEIKYAIKSPSKVTRDRIGKNLGLGVAGGLKDSTAEVVKQASAMSDSLAAAMHMPSLNYGSVAGKLPTAVTITDSGGKGVADAITKALGAAGGAGAPIELVVNLDGQTIAKVTAPHMGRELQSAATNYGRGRGI